MSVNNSNKENKNGKSNSVTAKAKKTGRIMLRALILVVVFCVVIFGGVVLSDLLFSDDSSGTTPEIIAVTVSGSDIILNDDTTVTLDELKEYLLDAESKGELYTVALINDTHKPANYQVYNQIVDLLAQFDIICEKMKVTSTLDELYAATPDEVLSAY
ncbi:MAG: hypothetical protein IJ298_02445 [Ruminococcus sp.]|nr:hypothetical protein [Ruminococcus sp.]